MVTRLKPLSSNRLSDVQRYDPGESHSPEEAYQDERRMHPTPIYIKLSLRIDEIYTCSAGL